MKPKADWKGCLDSLMVKGVKPDENLIKSLIKTSKNKLLSEERLKMNNVTAASKLSLAYDSLRELLEALAVKRGALFLWETLVFTSKEKIFTKKS